MQLHKLGFYIHWNIGSLNTRRGNVLGDELYAQSLVRALRGLDRSLKIDVYAPNHVPAERLDVLVYMNDNSPLADWSSKRVLYLQNAYGEGADQKLAKLRNNYYDGYAFISNKLLEMHQAGGFTGIFLPFGVDVQTFHPRPFDPAWDFDVAYVGNDIKGTARSEAYLVPAAEYNFGLFGNWAVEPSRFRFWNRWGLPPYKYLFEKLARGKIPQGMVPVLYSSSRINVNCTAQDCVDWDVITLRTLEVLACDGFLISDRVPSAERLLGDYVVFTDGYDDLRHKISYYLGDEVARKSRAEAGGRYVRENHSIHATAQKLLDYLKEL